VENAHSGEVVINAQNNSNQTNTTTNSLTSNASKNYELKNADIGLPDDNNTNITNNNPLTNYNTNVSSGSSSVDSFNKGYAQGQKIADVATGIADLFAPTPAQLQRRAAEAAENERLEKLNKETKQNAEKSRFIKVYFPLMEKAKNGNEKARMMLYYASYHLYSTGLVPQRKQWFDEALSNLNLNAIREQVEIITNEGGDRMAALQEAARLGSIDAMIALGGQYDLSSTYYKGSNATLALKAFTEAAEKGSPNAMYYLGMTYQKL